MRIGLTVYGSLDGRSGGFRYDRRLVEELRDAGDTVRVVELPWRTYPRGLLDNLTPSLRARLDVDVDVMLQDELAHPSLLRPNRILPYPVVSVVHHLRADEGRPLAPLYRTVEHRYFTTVDGAVCNSAATRDAVVSTGGLTPDDTLVAPPAGDRFDPAIDGETIAERACEEPLEVVFVGNILPRKGVTTLVDGLAAVDEPWHLTVVGRPVDADYAARARAAAASAGTADRVTFTGEVTDDELAAVLRGGHLLAVPSRHEGFGIAYLEGMGFGLPAVASAAGGASDIVTDGENGVLVDPDDPAAVTRAVEQFARDRARLAEMGRAARRRFESHPDWQETTDRVRAFLRDVVTGERRGAVA